MVVSGFGSQLFRLFSFAVTMEYFVKYNFSLLPILVIVCETETNAKLHKHMTVLYLSFGISQATTAYTAF